MWKIGYACEDYSNGESYDDGADDDSSRSQVPARHDFEISLGEFLGVGV